MTNAIPIIIDDPQSESEAGFGAINTPLGNLPLKALDVCARVDGLLARTVVRQSFTNPHSQPLEATYIFPLPDRAAVNRFVMRVGQRTIEGELQGGVGRGARGTTLIGPAFDQLDIVVGPGPEGSFDDLQGPGVVEAIERLRGASHRAGQ